MRQSAAGDGLAFRALVERHHAAVYRLARRQLGSSADAEDIVQETFQRLFVAAARYRPEVPLRGYLLTIAGRLCLNRRARHEHSRVELRAPEGLEAAGESESVPEQQRLLEQREQDARVRRALDALPADQRLAIVLLRFEGQDCAQIARSMKRSVGAVHALLFRARGALRQSLGARPGPEREEVEHGPKV
jgi:RNA polymerase sigma-70 factor (ECF subfamily)